MYAEEWSGFQTLPNDVELIMCRLLCSCYFCLLWSARHKLGNRNGRWDNNVTLFSCQNCVLMQGLGLLCRWLKTETCWIHFRLHMLLPYVNCVHVRNITLLVWYCMTCALSCNMYINQQDAQNSCDKTLFSLHALHVSDCINPSSGATFYKLYVVFGISCNIILT